MNRSLLSNGVSLNVFPFSRKLPLECLYFANKAGSLVNQLPKLIILRLDNGFEFADFGSLYLHRSITDHYSFKHFNLIFRHIFTLHAYGVGGEAVVLLYPVFDIVQRHPFAFIIGLRIGPFFDLGLALVLLGQSNPSVNLCQYFFGAHTSVSKPFWGGLFAERICFHPELWIAVLQDDKQGSFLGHVHLGELWVMLNDGTRVADNVC